MSDLPLLDRELVTDYLRVTDKEAVAATRMLAKEERIFAGFSTGANLAAALPLLRGRERGATVAFLVADSGLKYLSTQLYPAQAPTGLSHRPGRMPPDHPPTATGVSREESEGKS
jgi:threonine synthase